MSPLSLLAGLGVLAALAALAPRSRRVQLVAAILVAVEVIGAVVSIRVLATDHALTGRTTGLLPITGVRIDLTPLGALFTLTTAFVALAATIHWLGYRRHAMSSASATSAFALFVTSLLLVPAAGDIATFLVLWEVMALSSLVLVAHDHASRDEARQAAWWYGAMTQGGAALITLGLVVLGAHAKDPSFSSIAASARHLPGAARAAIFLALFVGFAAKAGLVPAHVWLPRAHAEAPAPASALLSGAMVNLGIYGIVLTRTLLGVGPAWWWLVAGFFGVISALYGSLYAATSTDLKRLLAYSTSDNMGLVVIGLSASGLFYASHPAASSLALVATLFLVTAHALYKSTLFLGAGSVQYATHERNLDQLGGLARTMPVTSVAVVIGALAVAALPPLNGFSAEWLVVQSLVHGLASADPVTTVATTVFVAALALTGGLTIVAFVKAVGIGFFGRARSERAEHAREVPVSMRIGPGITASACVVVGVAPGLALTAITRASATVMPHPSGLTATLAGFHLGALRGAVDPLALALGAVAATLLVAALRRSRGPRTAAKLRSFEPWGSGRTVTSARMQYTATSFAEPLQRVFDDVLAPQHDLDVSHAVESRYYVERVAYASANDDVVERRLYRPVLALARWWGLRARGIANGSVHRYLAYGFVVLVIALVVVS